MFLWGSGPCWSFFLYGRPSTIDSQIDYLSMNCENFKSERRAGELTHFRNRIGESGIELIFKESIRMNGKDNDDSDVN